MVGVLITRATPEAQNFADLCRARNLTPVIVPMMIIDIHETPIDLHGVGALAFTSTNGVRAFVANSEERALPVFAVGPVTAERAKAAGFKDVRVAGGDVAHLGNDIASERALINGAVLHGVGADRAGDLVGALVAQGVSARRQTLYQATATDALPEAAVTALEQDPTIDWVSFFSPRTARVFLHLVQAAGLEARLQGVRAACLSAPVADVAGQSSWRSISIAPVNDARSLLDMIVADRDTPA